MSWYTAVENGFVVGVKGLLCFLGVSLFYRIGEVIGNDAKTRFQAIRNAVGGLLVIMFFLLSFNGTHTEESDPVFGGGQTVVDFKPSTKEQVSYAITVLVFLGVPVISGAARAELKTKEKPT